MKRNQFIAILATAMLVTGAITGMSAFEQQATLKQRPDPVPTIGSPSVEPAFVVVNTPTQVAFTSQISDRQLKKRSVVLVRLDASGNPSDFVGRLHDDGQNGDLKANDSIYSLRATLNEPTVDPIRFRVAARFKPGQWREPEPDDDDWEVELSFFESRLRDRPAERDRLLKLLRRLDRYTFSAPTAVNVWRTVLDSNIGLTVSSPPQYVPVTRTDTSTSKIVFFTNDLAASDGNGSLFSIVIEPLLPAQTLLEHIRLVGGETSTIAAAQLVGRQYFRWREDLGDGLAATSYSALFSPTEVITITTMSTAFATSDEFAGIIAALRF